MRVTGLDNLLRPNRAYRAVALFFLAFTFVDLACPWFCQEDLDGFTKIVQAQTTTDAGFSPSLNGDERQNSNPSKPESLEEDCFCCCTHLQPSSGPGAPSVSPLTAAYIPPPARLPTAPPAGTDHPPRSAAC
jgi:hypothetical protein